MQKKKLLIISGVIVIIIVLGIVICYFFTKGKSSKSSETDGKQEQTMEEKVQHLRQRLNQVKEELNKPENAKEKIKYFIKLSFLEEDLNNFSQKSKQEQEEIVQVLEDFIKNVEKKLKSKNELISGTFKLDNSNSKIGYWLFEEEGKRGEISKVYIFRTHPFFKGKKLDDSADIPSFSIKFKKGDVSSQEKESKIFYFEKDNSNFELKPLGNWPDITQKEELKEIVYIGEKIKSPVHFGSDNYVFSYSVEGKEKYVHINEKHPKIEELLSQDKLKKDKKFTIRYFKYDHKTEKALFFRENNEELEIIAEV